MKNHLFIGLGGQGGRSLAEIRRVIAQRGKEAQSLKEEHRVDWAYLSIDSSSDVWSEGSQWSYFGEDLSLGDREKRELIGIKSAQSISTLSARDEIKPWIGDRGALEQFVDKNKEIEGANQKRRFGRLLMANTADKVKAAIAEKTRDLTRHAEKTCAFHIFASLAGGTGSGGIVDLITLIRSQFPDRDVASGYPIFLYLYLTGDDLNGADVGYFFQNQYAAIRDINALVSGRFRPTVLGEGGGRPFDGTDTFAQVVLSTDSNSNNYDLSLETQIRIVAEGCFERIHAWAAGNMSADTQRSLTGQDILASFNGEPNNSQEERSYRFSSMGMRRWEVPHARVNELLALDVEVSALRQMLYNTWDKEKGFTETAASLGVDATQVHLKQIEELIKPYLLDGSNRGADLSSKLKKGLKEHTDGILNAGGEDATLTSLEERLKTFVTNEFEGSGIEAVFDQETLHRSSHISEVETEIDSLLSRMWLDPSSPIGLFQVIDLLQRQIENLRSLTDGEASSAVGSEKLKKRIHARGNEWEKITSLSRLCGKERALIRAHSSDLSALYSQELLQEFRSSDRELLKGLLSKLSRDLKQAYQKSYDRLELLLSKAKKERDLLSNELESLEEKQISNKYEFDRDALGRFLEEMRRTQNYQVDAAGAIREHFVDLDNPHLLSVLDSRVKNDRERFDIKVQSTAMTSAKSIHRELIRNDDDSIINESLMDRLEDRFGDNDAELLNEVREFVSLAASSLDLRTTEELQPTSIIGDGRGVPAMPKRLFVLGLPNHPYSQVMEEKFRDVIAPGERFIFDFYRHDDPSQLRLLTVDYWMAARFASVVHKLHNKYDGVETNPGSGDLRYFCNIDESGEKGQRPSLLHASVEEMREALEAELWLAARPELGVLQEGEEGVFLISESAEGTNSERLGASSDEIVDRAGIKEMHQVHAVVSHKLSTLSSDEVADLQAVVKAEEAKIKEEVGLTGAKFQKWMTLRTQISKLLTT